jgi:hypothetical protein
LLVLFFVNFNILFKLDQKEFEKETDNYCPVCTDRVNGSWHFCQICNMQVHAYCLDKETHKVCSNLHTSSSVLTKKRKKNPNNSENFKESNLKIIDEIKREFQEFINGGKRRLHSTSYCVCNVCFVNHSKPMEKIDIEDMKSCLVSKTHKHIKKECWNQSRECSLCSTITISIK